MNIIKKAIALDTIIMVGLIGSALYFNSKICLWIAFGLFVMDVVTILAIKYITNSSK